MVATIKPIQNAKEAATYFYMLEANQELKKGFHQNDVTKELGFANPIKENLEKALSGKLTKDIELGRIENGQKVHHPGQELILSAPKSVSIMALVVGSDEVLNAHEKAVERTLDYIQRNIIHYRIQKDGKKDIEKSDNAIIAKFTHQSSRSVDGKVPDPQLHTHCLIANATKGQDGIYRSVVFDELYKSKMNIGEIYRMELAKNIRELGYDALVYKDKGRLNFEIKGISKEIIDEFSKRRQQILEFAKEHGIEDSKGLAYAASVTRGKKTEFTDLREIWKQKNEFNIPQKTELHHIKRSKEQITKLAMEQLSEREAVWNYKELHRVLIQKNRSDYSISEIEGYIKEESSLIKLANNNYTSKENITIEKELISLMKLGQGNLKPILNKMQLLEKTSLNKGQKEAIKLILTSCDRVIGIQGIAGSGKTTMLRNLNEILKSDRVIGLAPTKSATKVLKEEASMDAETLSHFLIKNQNIRSNYNLVILDEASLCSNFQVKKLLDLSFKHDFRLVMIGDSKQQGGVEAGKPFDLLCKNGMQSTKMGKIQRQKNPDLLKAVYAAHSAVDSPFAKEYLYEALSNIKNIIYVKNGTNENFANACYAKFKEVKDQNPLIIIPSNDLKDNPNCT